MKYVGRQPRGIAPKPSGDLLAEGMRFNDAVHKLPSGDTTFFPRGIYRYKTHEDANAHWEACVIEGMASQVRRRGA